MPLFLFHILEYMNVDFDLDVDEINERWEELASEDVWSQMILKETDDIVQRLTATPRTGQYSLDGSGAWCSAEEHSTGISSRTNRRRSSCGSTGLGTTGGRARTWVFW